MGLGDMHASYLSQSVHPDQNRRHVVQRHCLPAPRAGPGSCPIAPYRRGGLSRGSERASPRLLTSPSCCITTPALIHASVKVGDLGAALLAPASCARLYT
eukprot:758060-Hanusia_phi.AAC.5